MKKFIIINLIIILFGPFILNVDALDNNFISNARSGLLMDVDTGKIIYKKDIHKKYAVASMTKMVAQILILDNIKNKVIKWDDVVTVSKNASDMGGSQIYLAEGEKITVKDLMKGISIASGNDATVAMAEYISGSENKFVKLMNEEVRKLGLKDTHFKNCTGLDEDGHYSTAYDMAIIGRKLITSYPEILNFSSIYEDYLRENTKNKFWLVNTNKLIHFYEGADGLKTGHTDNAGYCLAATAKRGGVRLLGIVLGEKNASVRNRETMELLDYGFSMVKTRLLKNKGEIVKKIKVDKATKEIVNIKLKDDLYINEVVDNYKKNYKYKVILKRLKFPLKKGTVVGQICVLNKNNVIKKQDLIVDSDIDLLSFYKLFMNELKDIILGIY